MGYRGRVAFYTFGCKLNFAETSAIGSDLSARGFDCVNFEEPADYYVINTCSVTENADRKSRALIRQKKRQAPGAKIIMVGCYAQLKPEQIAAMEGVDMVLGASEKFDLAAQLDRLKGSEETLVAVRDIRKEQAFAPAFSSTERTRAFLKVQDGCDYHCSFCTIPLARGRSRSTRVDKIVEQAEAIALQGFKEVVLTGVNTGDFGRSEDGRSRSGENFLDLLTALDRVEDIERFRISSIEPNLLSDEILDFVAASDRFMPHFHVPLQSGSDEILRLMRRRYDSNMYRQRIEGIRARMPEACIGVDVIVGFPGERQAHFEETRDLLIDLDVSYLHVFTYSERGNTPAAKMTGVVPVEERRARNARIRAISDKKKRAHYRRAVGELRPVLFESRIDGADMLGYTDNYIQVRHPFDPNLVNRICQVEITAVTEACDALCSEFVFSENKTLAV